MTKKLNELIEEQGKKFDHVFAGENTSFPVGETSFEIPDYYLDEIWAFFKTALKEIALQSIEACEVEEDTAVGKADGSRESITFHAVQNGWNAAREEAKQRAGVFLGEV